MSGYVLSPAAQHDLDEIWDYTAARWNVAQADRYILGIRDTCSILASDNRTARSIEGVRKGYYKASVGSHFVIFRYNREGVVVTRVLHQRMDVTTQLKR